MRNEPLIPKLRTGEWKYHSSKNEDGTNNGSVIAYQGGMKFAHAYCLAKQPRYVKDGEWETHAKAFTAVPNMLKYLIEEWYSLGEKMMEIDKHLERGSMTNKHPYQKKHDEYRAKYDEVEKILKEAGAFDEDLW